MDQEKILTYAMLHVEHKIEKLRGNLEMETISPFQRKNFQKLLAGYEEDFEALKMVWCK